MVETLDIVSQCYCVVCVFSIRDDVFFLNSPVAVSMHESYKVSNRQDSQVWHARQYQSEFCQPTQRINKPFRVAWFFCCSSNTEINKIQTGFVSSNEQSRPQSEQRLMFFSCKKEKNMWTHTPLSWNRKVYIVETLDSGETEQQTQQDSHNKRKHEWNETDAVCLFFFESKV